MVKQKPAVAYPWLLLTCLSIFGAIFLLAYAEGRSGEWVDGLNELVDTPTHPPTHPPTQTEWLLA